MLVNISDAIVMNAKPKYALIGIKIPSSFTPLQLEALADGFLKAAKEFGFQIIGGDTVAGETLDISITIISETAHPIYRTGIEQSDLVAFTGDIGSVKQDLEKLLRGEKISENSKFITPRLRAPFFYEAASYIHAALDISDGLSKDLSRLSRINGVGFAFNRNISQKQLCSGEEYEILFTFPPKNLDTLKAIAQKYQTPLTIFATATEGSYESVCPENHFQE
jgi:thiamine-monophosphate kinase